MKVIKSQAEAEALVKDGVLTLDESVTFDCSITLSASLKIAGDISARDISARNISAGDISAGDIRAWDISAGNIRAGDIRAWDISAGNISVWAFAIAYFSFKCKSLVARRENHVLKCLDGEIEYVKDEPKCESRSCTCCPVHGADKK